LESAEVLEHFQWKTAGEVNTYIAENKHEIAEELADALYWILLMSYAWESILAEHLRTKY
jgi:NTP pyrophosphatase (non-canonical NTP hydrolase)